MESTLKKGQASFQLIGLAKVNDFTFKTDQESQNSDWVYNSMRIGVTCGQYGDIYAEMMGGYGAERDNVVYVHGKKEEDGKTKDDWKNQYKIDWADRFDEDITDEIGESCFIRVGIELDKSNKVFTKKFLSEYDAIAYIKEHLEDGMAVNVKGDIEYSVYNSNTQTKKKITSIYLSKVEDVEKHVAKFTQTILVDKDGVEKVDKEKNVFPITGYVVDYVNKPLVDGKKIEVKENVSFPKSFEFAIKDPEKTSRLVKKLFKPSKASQLFEVTVEGVISKGGTANVDMGYDDLPEDIQELVDLEAFTLEEALEKCVGKQSTVESYVITGPQIRIKDNDGEKTPIISFDKDKYKSEELLSYAQAVANATGEEPEVEVEEDYDIDSEDFDMDSLLEGIE